MKAAYFQSIGGASGDMTLGALVDAGVPLATITGAMDAMKRSRRPNHRRASAARRRHWYPRPRRFGRGSVQDAQFRRLHSRRQRRAAVRARQVAVHRRLPAHGGRRGRVHRTTADHLHLHELGTLDTLVDVVGAVAGLEWLGVERVFASPFPMGTGVFRSAHGILPVPSPATAALFDMANAPLVPAPNNPVRTGEMVTPTGAGIITTLAEFRQPQMAMSAHGYGLGNAGSGRVPPTFLRCG